eukprot:gene3894-4256_t
MLPHFEESLKQKYLLESSPSKQDDNGDASSLMALTRIAMEKRWSVYQNVFADLSTDQAKLLLTQTQATANISNEEKDFSTQFASGFIYGEVNYASFLYILQHCQIRPGEVFVDLGHGTGKAIVTTALAFGDVLSRIYGIELLHPLFEESVKRIQCYRNIISEEGNANLFSKHQLCQIDAVEGDFLTSDRDEYDWTQADMVFVNSTCFDGNLMKRIAERAEKMHHGARIVTLTYSLPSTNFEVIWKEDVCMSWGLATAFLHVRR